MATQGGHIMGRIPRVRQTGAPPSLDGKHKTRSMNLPQIQIDFCKQLVKDQMIDSVSACYRTAMHCWIAAVKEELL